MRRGRTRDLEYGYRLQNMADTSLHARKSSATLRTQWCITFITGMSSSVYANRLRIRNWHYLVLVLEVGD